MAALLQCFAQGALEKAASISKDAITCSELQTAIKGMGWPEQSGLLNVHIIGAALGHAEANE